MGPRRHGGTGVGPDDETLVWSVAEGTLGARWREVASRDGAVRRSVLLEVSPTGRPARLEIATTDGLLTLHPEPDESALHGNVVTRDGIRHLAFRWSPAHQLLVVPSPAAATVLARTFDGALLVGEQVAVEVVRVDDGLEPVAETWILTYVDLGTWWLRSTAANLRTEVRLDPTGLPVLGGAIGWPLEHDGG